MKLHADLHSHSHYSRDSILSPRRFIDTCLRKGISCIAVTDHNEINGAFVIERLAKAQAAPLKVIVGEEIKTSEGEIIGLFLKELVPRGLTPEDTIRAIREQGGLVTVPHPYDAFRRSVIKREALDRIAPVVDAIEGFNCRNILSYHDDQARALAQHFGKPITVGSDAHSALELGGVYIEVDDFETPAQFLQGLSGATVAFKRSLPMVHWISTFAKIRWRLGLRPRYETPVSR